MSDELIFGETYGDLSRAFVKAYGKLGQPSLATFEPADLDDLDSIDPPLLRAVLRARAQQQLRDADRLRHPDALWSIDRSEIDDVSVDVVIDALFGRFVERRRAGIPVPEPFFLPPPAA